MDDREEALADLGHALGRVVTAAMADLPAKPCQLICEAINAGEAKMQLLIDFDPVLRVLGSLVTTSDGRVTHTPVFVVGREPAELH